MSLTPKRASLLLTLPLLVGCPGDDAPADGSSTTIDETSTTTEEPPPSTESSTTLADTDTDTTQPPDTDTDTTPPPPPDTDTDTDTDTDGKLTGCDCIVDDAPVDETDPPSAPTCGEALCPTVVGSCWDGYCGKTPFELEDPAALECALIALRDRTPGRIGWSWAENAGQYDQSGYVLVNEDGTAVRRDWGWQDLDYIVDDAVLGQLPPPEHFDACLAEPDDSARFDCLRGGLESMLDVCDAGWTYSKI